MLSLSDVRRRYKPKIPSLLHDPQGVNFEKIKTLSIDSHVAPYFPYTKDISALKGKQGVSQKYPPTKIGVVFSGGPASGGHNVVSGIFDTLQQIGNIDSLLGFIGGPGAIVSGSYKELKAGEVDCFRNQGGFDLLGS
ncbi:MAG: diphosphate--fructose-6-phosphate 1-phosphotransferase, partial [Rhabdochlamydiaceae bacterium]